MRRTPGKRSRSMATESSVEPLSATITSATSDGVCATTDGRNFSSNFRPFQFKRMTDTFIDGFVNGGGKSKPRGQSARRLRSGRSRLRSFPSTRPDLAGVPDGLYRGKEIFLVPGQTSPASADAPTPRKPSNNLLSLPTPRGGCGVAASNVFLVPGQTSPAAAAALTPSEGGTNIHDKVFPAHPAYLCRRLSGIGMRCERSDTMSDYYLLLRDYSNYYL